MTRCRRWLTDALKFFRVESLDGRLHPLDQRPCFGQPVRITGAQQDPLGKHAIQLGGDQQGDHDTVDAQSTDESGDVGVRQPAVGDFRALEVGVMQTRVREVAIVEPPTGPLIS
jgi:hypothetical protein